MSEELKQKVLEFISAARKRQKPGEIASKLSEELGVERSAVKDAIKELAKEDKLVFTYYGSSFVELPGSERPKEME
jgi:Mn-dependent DtxR family transcriptional regulator